MTIPSKLEIALAPDRLADPVSWTWRDVTADTRTNAIAMKRGRSEGATLAEPGSFTVPMYNGDGRYSPRNPESAHYPNIVRGMPVRHSSTFGARQLVTTGASGLTTASTPDAASLDIVGDISGVIEFGSPVRVPVTGTTLMPMGKYASAGNQRSYMLELASTGAARFRWSTDGIAASQITTTNSIPRPDTGPLSIGWYLDVNNGAGGRTIRWYVLRGTLSELLADLDAALFEEITVSGTTSIFASTATLQLGGNSGVTTGGFLNYPGLIRRFQLRSGDLSTGTIVANPDFTTQAAGTVSFADTAAVPKTWTINSPAAITASKTTMVGELTGNHPVWPANGAPGTARAIWEVSGILRRLRQGKKPLRSSLFRLVTGKFNTTTLVAYWPFEDTTGATQVASPVAGVRHGTIGPDVRMGVDDTFIASSPLANVPAGRAGSFVCPVDSADPSVTAWRAELFFKIPTPAAAGSGTTLIIVTANGTATQYAVWIDDTNVNFDIKNALGATLVISSFASDDRFFDVWALISVGFSQVGGDILYEIKIIPEEGSAAGSVFGTSGLIAGTVGQPKSVQTVIPVAPPDGISFGHVIVSEGNPLGWLAPADSAYVGEPATSRFFRLCGEEGIPGLVDGVYGTNWEAVLAAESSNRTMGPQRPLALLDLLEECAAVEQGYLGESRELFGLTLRGYRSLLGQSPAVTLGTPGNKLINPFEPADDDQRFVNDATVKRVMGSSARYVDTASVAASGIYDDEKEYNVERDLVLPNYAAWRVIRSLWPEMRYPQIATKIVDPDSLLLDAWHDTCVGDLIVAQQLPDEHPTPTIAQVMEGYSQTISAVGWEINMYGAPAGPFTVGHLDDDPLTPDTSFARLDSSGSTLASGITSTATSLSVTVAAGSVLWTTAANQRPFDIIIGGERMTVTNLTGASSPQTFTVTRSVNGVVKAHSAGAQVHVYYPIRVTL